MPTLLAYAGSTVWMPPAASTFAGEVDWLFYFTYWMSVFFFVLIGVAMFWFAYRYRQKDRDKVAHGSNHNNMLEVTWTVIPLILVLCIFMWGFKAYLDMTTPPANAYEIQVNAKQWSWSFTYPQGAVSDILHVPANRPVRLILNSVDVIHSFYVPDFRVKKDVVPGRYNKLWFEAKWDPKRAGKVTIPRSGGQDEVYDNAIAHHIFCAEYCGTGHSQMRSTVVVQQPADFAKWVEKQRNPLVDKSPVEAGQYVAQVRGCVACHSADGSKGVGPSWKDLFGHQVTVTDTATGKTETITADENYIHRSIKTPSAQIVQGFANVMPQFSQIKPAEIKALIAYMKSISKYAKNSQ